MTINEVKLEISQLREMYFNADENTCEEELSWLEYSISAAEQYLSYLEKKDRVSITYVGEI